MNRRMLGNNNLTILIKIIEYIKPRCLIIDESHTVKIRALFGAMQAAI